MECIQNKQEEYHIPGIIRQNYTVGDGHQPTDFIAGKSLNSVILYESWCYQTFVSLPTRPVVHCELVRDEAIQERVDFVHNGSVGTPKATPIIHIARTHRICPLGAYLSLDPVNKFPYIANLVTRTKGCVIQAHSEPSFLKSRRNN